MSMFLEQGILALANQLFMDLKRQCRPIHFKSCNLPKTEVTLQRETRWPSFFHLIYPYKLDPPPHPLQVGTFDAIFRTS